MRSKPFEIGGIYSFNYDVFIAVSECSLVGRRFNERSFTFEWFGFVVKKTDKYRRVDEIFPVERLCLYWNIDEADLDEMTDHFLLSGAACKSKKPSFREAQKRQLKWPSSLKHVLKNKFKSEKKQIVFEPRLRA